MIRELVKNWRQRLSAFLLVSALIVLIDEVVKEGYVFNPADLLTPAITHEKIFLALIVIAMIIGGGKNGRCKPH